jgi:hypothetical protein
VEPLRTDFTGYEGKYVAIDARTGEVVLSDELGIHLAPPISGGVWLGG